MSVQYKIILHIEYCLTSYLHMPNTDNCKALLIANVPVCVGCVSVSLSIYELITGSTGNEMPHHWYTDQRFMLFLVCLFAILPLSIPKEIWIQKYTR